MGPIRRSSRRSVADMLRVMASHPVHEYEKNGAEIYRRSFATIRAQADLSRFSPEESQVAVRMIHACGMVDLVDDIAFSPGAILQARAALRGGAPILCDAQMVASVGVHPHEAAKATPETFERLRELLAHPQVTLTEAVLSRLAEAGAMGAKTGASGAPCSPGAPVG